MDEFDRVVGWAEEAERREKAQPFLDQFNRGMITVAELRDKLAEVVAEPMFEEG